MPRAGGSIAIVPRSTGGSGTFDMDGQTVLLHEYSHHFMMSEVGAAAYPAWYIEGFAEFNSTTRFEKDGAIGFGLPANYRAYGLMRLSMPAEKLFTSDADLKNDNMAEAFYSRSWLLTHYLTYEPSRQGQLRQYLKAINDGRDSLAAAREVFGDFKKLDAELDRYKTRKRLPYLRLTPEELQIGAVSVRELSPAQDALMELRIRSDRGVGREEAIELVARIRKAAAPYPNDAIAQAILAEAEYDAGNYDAAEAAADRAIAADPKSIDALLYKGRALAGKLVQAKSEDPKAWKEVRSWLVKANKLDPEHAEPLLLFYNSFGQQGGKPSASAVAGLIKAHDLAPQDRALRMQVAREYLLAGKVEDARFTLAPIAFDPHAGEMGKFAAALLASLSKGDAKAAVRILEAEPEAKGGAAE
jgi:tetratricopeptide (TPR) repeat protein